MWKVLIASLGLFAVWSVCLAGPNEGGVLILHVNESLQYADGHDYCGESGITRCLEADVRADGSDIRVFHLLAAFPEHNAPDVAVIYFGINYDSAVTIVDHGSCSDGEIPDPGWPQSGTGTAVAWGPPFRTEQLFEVYWFAAYVGDGSPAVCSAAPHPQLGGYFVDPSIVEIFDPIADYGSLGFGTDGYLPCPDATPTDVKSWGKIKAIFRR